MIFKTIICISLGLYSSIVLPTEYDEQDLNKLFTDRQQRESIDAKRSGQTVGKEVKKSEQVNVRGYLTRSDGKSVVWVNNKNTLDSSRINDVKVYPSTVGKNKSVLLSVDGKTKRLKPGETWQTTTGKVVDKH